MRPDGSCVLFKKISTVFKLGFFALNVLLNYVSMIEITILKSLIPVYLLYFFYGLAFLFLGASISVRDMKDSKLKLAGNLWLLSGFGFTHGAHEWIQLFLLMSGESLSGPETFLIKITGLFLVQLSFLFLLQFGFSLISSIRKKTFFQYCRLGSIILFFLFFFILWRFESIYDLLPLDRMDRIVRKTFGLMGSLITAYALIIYSREVKRINTSIARYFLFTGLGFLFYGFVAGLVPSHSSIPLLGVPIEFFRGVSAVLITYFLFKALNIFDIETRKKLELQIKHSAHSEKMASLGQLAAGVAHEINTPLTNALLSIEMLRGRISHNFSEQHTVKKLNAIERNIERATTIAKELLQFSHQREFQLVPNNINNILNSSLILLQYKLKNVALHREKNDLPEVNCDAAKLEQVFINVINNAIEAMPEGGDLFISTGSESEELWIRVRDTGMGIPKEDLSKAFDPFFTTKPIGQGTGLGLSICYGIIKQHQGTIKLEGTGEKGTTVTIRLPIT